MRKSLSFHSSVRYFKYIVLVLLFYPLTVLGAQGHITVKGQSITIKEAIMLIEKNSNYVFFYNAADLKNIRLKNINCSGDRKSTRLNSSHPSSSRMPSSA